MKMDFWTKLYAFLIGLKSDCKLENYPAKIFILISRQDFTTGGNEERYWYGKGYWYKNQKGGAGGHPCKKVNCIRLS